MFQVAFLFWGSKLTTCHTTTAGFKRAIERVKPTLKRTVARRGVANKRQCGLSSQISTQSLPLCDDGSNFDFGGFDNVSL